MEWVKTRYYLSGNNVPGTVPAGGNIRVTGYLVAYGGLYGNDNTLDDGSGNVTIAGNTKLAAGTTSLAPLTFQSGTNLTTAAAGDVEFDGTAFYASAAASDLGRSSTPSSSWP